MKLTSKAFATFCWLEANCRSCSHSGSEWVTWHKHQKVVPCFPTPPCSLPGSFFIQSCPSKKHLSDKPLLLGRASVSLTFNWRLKQLLMSLLRTLCYGWHAPQEFSEWSPHSSSFSDPELGQVPVERV